MARNDVVIRFRADTRDAEQGMDRLGKQSKGLELDIKKLALGAGAATAAFTGLALGAKSLVQAYQVQAQAERTLATVVTNTGASYADVEQKILRTTAALQAKTNFGDEAQIQALAKMTLILGDVDKAMAALPAVLDASAVSGRDLQTVAETLTKALAGNANTAESLGMVFDDTADFAERLEQVQSRISGAAEDNADPFVQLGNAMGDFQEVLGGLLSGPLTETVQGLTAIVGGVQQLVDLLAANNVMWDENGKRIRPIVEESKSLAKWTHELADGYNVIIDPSGQFVQILTDEELALKKVTDALNTYAITADQVAAINRANFDAQVRLEKIEIQRNENLIDRTLTLDRVMSLEDEWLLRVNTWIESERKRIRAEKEAAAALKAQELAARMAGGEVLLLTMGLQENAEWTEAVANIIRLAEEETITWIQAEEMLAELIPNINEQLREHQRELRKAAEEYRELTRQAIIAAQSVAQAGIGFGGNAPSGIPVTRAFTDPHAADILFNERFGRTFLEEHGLTPETFGEFFFNLVKNILASGQAIDRAEALVMAINRIESDRGGAGSNPFAVVPDLPTFDTGGVVPGPTGSRQLVMAHGGETILPTHRGGMAGMSVNIDLSGSTIMGIDDLDSVINQSVSNALRRANKRQGRR